MHAGAVHERIWRRGWRGPAHAVVVQENFGLIETQIVERAVVSGLFLAVVVRGVRNELRESQISLDLYRCQVKPVGIRALRGIRADELVVAWIGVNRPVSFHVIPIAVL